MKILLKLFFNLKNDFFLRYISKLFKVKNLYVFVFMVNFI